MAGEPAWGSAASRASLHPSVSSGGPAFQPATAPSHVDDRLYAGFDVWNELRVGYTFDFEIGGQSFYVIPDTLVGFGATTNRWPGADEDLGLTWIPLDVDVGWRF
jgi:hypothetical protein